MYGLSVIAGLWCCNLKLEPVYQDLSLGGELCFCILLKTFWWYSFLDDKKLGDCVKNYSMRIIFIEDIQIIIEWIFNKRNVCISCYVTKDFWERWQSERYIWFFDGIKLLFHFEMYPSCHKILWDRLRTGLLTWEKKTCVLLHEESKYNLSIKQINQRTWLLQIPGEFLMLGVLLWTCWFLVKCM